jgi:hypothetical protein
MADSVAATTVGVVDITDSMGGTVAGAAVMGPVAGAEATAVAADMAAGVVVTAAAEATVAAVGTVVEGMAADTAKKLLRT